MRKGVQHEAGGVIHLDRCVGRQNDASARGAMLGDGLLEAMLIVLVERAEGFVEKPQRGGDHE